MSQDPASHPTGGEGHTPAQEPDPSLQAMPNAAAEAQSQTVPEQRKGNAGAGVLMILGFQICWVLGCLIVAAFSGSDTMADSDEVMKHVMAISFVQVVFLVPATIVCLVKGKTRTVAGMWVVAIITFLPSFACYSFLSMF